MKSLIQKCKVKQILLCLGSMIVLLCLFCRMDVHAEKDYVSGSCSQDGNVTWKLYDTGILEIEGNGAINLALSNWKDRDGNAIDKNSIKEMKIAAGVNTIGDDVFRSCSTLTKVEVTGDLISIGIRAFRDCSSLSSVDLSNCHNLESIGNYAFMNDSYLSRVLLPTEVKNLGNGAFYQCSILSNINLADCSQLESIGSYAFEYCSKLPSLKLSSGLKSIGSAAFECSSVRAVDLSDCRELESIGNVAFEGCSNLEELKLSTGLKTLGKGVFHNCKLLRSMDLSGCNNMGAIEEASFRNCTSLTEVKLPVNLTKIGENAFCECTSLASLNLNVCDQLESIGDYAFLNCESIVQVDLSKCSKLEGIGSAAFKFCVKLEDLKLPTECLTTIGSTAFYQCSLQGSLDLSSCDKLEIIDNYAFGYCSGLTELKVSAGITRLGEGAFVETSIGSLDLSTCDELQTIEDYAFEFCSNLKDVSLPAGLTSIGKNAFYCCGSLAEIDFPENIKSIGVDAFAHCKALAQIHFSSAVESIATDAFQDCSGLENVDVEAMADWFAMGFETEYSNPLADSDTAELTINGGKGVEVDLTELIDASKGDYTIPARTFYHWTDLETVRISKNVTEIGRDAFKACENIRRIDVDSIDHWCSIAYQSRYSIPTAYKAVHGDSTDLIRFYADGDEMRDITLTSSVSSIPEYAFACSNIHSVTISDRVKKIGKDAFYHCEKLESVSLPSDLDTIEEAVFSGCKSLLTIDLPDAVSTIKEEAFADCADLSITVLENVTKISEDAFEGSEISLYGYKEYDGHLTEGYMHTKDYDPDSYANVSFAEYDPGSIKSETITKKTTSDSEETAYELTWMLKGSTLYLSGYGSMDDFSSDGANHPFIDAESGEDKFEKDKIKKVVIRSVLITETDGSQLRKGFENLGDYLFDGFENLTSVSIDAYSDISNIGSHTFANCGSKINLFCYANIYDDLYSIYEGSSSPEINVMEIQAGTIGNISWNYDEENKTLILKSQSKTSGCDSTSSYPFKDYKIKYADLSDYDCVDLPANLFSGCSGLKEVVWNDTISSIGENAFSGCSSLMFAKIQDNDYIDVNGEELLEDIIEIPEDVKTIEKNAFSDCTNIRTVMYFGENAISIGESAFANCSKFATVNGFDAAEAIGSCAFLNCEKIDHMSFSGVDCNLGDHAIGFVCDDAGNYSLDTDFTVEAAGEGTIQNWVIQNLGSERFSLTLDQLNTDQEGERCAFSVGSYPKTLKKGKSITVKVTVNAASKDKLSIRVSKSGGITCSRSGSGHCYFIKITGKTVGRGKVMISGSFNGISIPSKSININVTGSSQKSSVINEQEISVDQKQSSVLFPYKNDGKVTLHINNVKTEKLKVYSRDDEDNLPLGEDGSPDESFCYDENLISVQIVDSNTISLRPTGQKAGSSTLYVYAQGDDSYYDSNLLEIPVTVADQTLSKQTTKTGSENIQQTSESSKVKAKENVQYPSRLSRVKVKRISKKRVRISWKKPAHVTKYEIQYSRSKKFTKVKKRLISGKKTRKNLAIAKGKIWYIRIRYSYRTFTSKWKVIKVKK